MLVRGQLDSMLEALQRIPALADPDVRDTRVEDLRRALRRPLEITRFVDSRRDLRSIITVCQGCSGGLRTFAQIVQRHHRGDASGRAAALAEEIAGPTVLSPPDRESLRALLTGIRVIDLADAVADVAELADVPELRTLQTWRDTVRAIRAMERLAPAVDGVPPLLTFVARLAGVVTGPVADELRDWVDMVGGGLGVSAATVAELRTGGPRYRGPAATASEPEEAPAGWTHGERRPARPRRTDETGLIWGGVPIRNRNFTGRAILLEQLEAALRTSSKAAVLPQTLHGMGGVGKTQLVVEYVYRHLDQYDLVWWIAAEQTATVLSSLTALAERLGITASEERQQTARTVLDALAGGGLSWLLVYDNADDPDTLDQFLPSSGGDVIITTRLQEWAAVGPAIEVDVFTRAESIELLLKRSRDNDGNARILTGEADQLAEKLGDLPLALEQAAAWYLATAMPVKEYIELFDGHIELLSEGKPVNYPLSVAAFVTLAMERLRRDAPATAQLFELFAYLGGEPVAVSLLVSGKDANVTEPLRTLLGGKIPLNRAVRDLNRYGLAKVDAIQRVQVHRLVQRVLRDTMTTDRAADTLRNVRTILMHASPGDPDELGELDRHAQMGPHIEPARLIQADTARARQIVLDYARFLYLTGDYENSRRLTEQAAAAWAHDPADLGGGDDGELTLLARAQVANAHRALGDSPTAAPLARETYERFRNSPRYGPRHETTLITGNQVGADLRIAGRYLQALTFDQDSVAAHREVFGAEDDTYTLRAKTNLAVDYRMVGQYGEAFALDREVAEYWEDAGPTDRRALEAYMNMARSYYGMGAYRAGLEILERWREPLRETVGAGHRLSLLADRTYAILLRKAGRLTEAHHVIQETQELTRKRFGANHEYTVAATVSLANALRELGDVDEAQRQIADALGRYKSDYGERHPLTLVALVNEAMIRRARHDLAEARAADERCYRALTEVLSPEHPYTLCAGTSLATDLASTGEHAAALELSTVVLRLSRESSGGRHEARDDFEHPYLLMRAVNLAHDLRATGSIEDGDAMFEESFASLRRYLGVDHHEVVAIARGGRAESDIEPPPT
jgi:tetratricopeptide (TPR) repeat protein